MVISYSSFDRKIAKAKEILLEKGIISLDGSGKPDIEELFYLLSQVRNGKLILISL